MKIECPVCHEKGILEQRGNSQRVLHYRSISNGKRLYEKHRIKMGVMGVNGNKTLGIKEAENSTLLVNMAPPKGTAHRYATIYCFISPFSLVINPEGEASSTAD